MNGHQKNEEKRKLLGSGVYQCDSFFFLFSEFSLCRFSSTLGTEQCLSEIKTTQRRRGGGGQTAGKQGRERREEKEDRR